MSLECNTADVVALLATLASNDRRVPSNTAWRSSSSTWQSPRPSSPTAHVYARRSSIWPATPVKFTERGSVRIMVSLLLRGPNGSPPSRSSDRHRNGIREEVLPQLFQPSTKATHRLPPDFGGTDWDLAISRHIAHLLGGELTVTQCMGARAARSPLRSNGSLENVSLVRTRRGDAESGPQIWNRRFTTSRDAHLLAGDGFDNRELIQTVLRMAGAYVELQNGASGRQGSERAVLSDPK